MTMKIGDRLLQAEIQEKEKAREMYEDAKKEGRSASLLEQEKPNVFKMNVANIKRATKVINDLSLILSNLIISILKF